MRHESPKKRNGQRQWFGQYLPADDLPVPPVPRPSLTPPSPQPIPQPNASRVTVTATGLPFFDYFLDGGTIPGEVYGLLGPIDSFKSTLARLILMEAARKYAIAGDRRRAVLVAYEHKAAVARALTIYQLARIDRNKLGSGASLSAAERQRWQAAVDILKRHALVLELPTGNGYVPEIASALREYQEASGDKVGTVIIDYAGLAAKRHAGMQFNRIHYLIAGMPAAVRVEIAGAFACPVWLIHQLAGQANQKSPRELAHHTEAAEATNFAENLDFCLSLGTVKELPGGCKVGRMACDRHRRTQGRAPVLVTLDGRFGQVTVAAPELEAAFWAHGQPCRLAEDHAE